MVRNRLLLVPWKRHGDHSLNRWAARLDPAELGGIITLAALLLLLAAVPLGVSFAVSPEDIESGRVSLSPPCPRARAGVKCPGCGLTRGFTAMSRGRLGSAYRYNPWAPALYSFFWLIALGSGATLARAIPRCAELRAEQRSGLTCTAAGHGH